MKLDLPDLLGLLDFLVLPDYQVVMVVTVYQEMVNLGVMGNLVVTVNLDVMGNLVVTVNLVYQA